MGISVLQGREEVKVNSPPSVALSVSPDPATAGEAVTFDARESLDPDGEIVEYRWDFTGDGTIDARTAEPTTSHAFPESGFNNPDVTLEVTDTHGATGTRTETITVEETEGELVLDRIHPDAPGNDHENNPVVVTRYERVEPGEYRLEDLDAERVA